MIVGTGIDMVEVDRIADKVDRVPGFREKVFSKQECSYCERQFERYQHYAARFAAKEAFLKATGLGMLLTVDWHEIEVVSDVNGKPSIHLEGNVKFHAEQNGWKKLHISLSHVNKMACAMVIIET